MRKVKAKGMCFAHDYHPHRPVRTPPKILKNITITLPEDYSDDMERIAKELGQRIRRH